MKFHRHAQHLVTEGQKPTKETGYMFCDLCNCKPTSGHAGEPVPPSNFNMPTPVKPTPVAIEAPTSVDDSKLEFLAH